MARNENGRGEAARDGDGANGSRPSGTVQSPDLGDEGAANGGAQADHEPGNRLRFVGLGLIGSLVIGYSPLRDAFQGNGSFENAMFRFLACFVACIVATSIIGRILDGAPPPEDSTTESDDAAVGTASDEEHGLEPRDDGRQPVDAQAEANE